VEFRAEYSSQIATGAKADAAAVRQLRTELEAAAEALSEISKAKGPSGGGSPSGAGPSGPTGGKPGAGFDAEAFKKNVRATMERKAQEERALQELGLGLSQAEKDAALAQNKAKEKAEKDREKADKDREKAATKAADDQKKRTLERDRKLALGVGAAAGVAGAGFALARGAVGSVAQAAGIGGTADLARLALGYRGVAQLQAIMFRTQLQGRQLFRGVDPSPAVRAADRFFNSIFSGSRVAGQALQGIITRNVNDFFKLLESGQPTATAFFQALIIGALQVENSWLDLRLALLPVMDLIEDTIGPTDQLAQALGLGGSAAEMFGNSIRAVLQPMIDGAQIAGILADQINRLRAELGADNKIEFGGASAAGPQGMATGKAYADGLAKGAASGAGAVDAAGRNLGIGLDKGVRAATETHSPSKVAERTGKEYPAGYAIGVEKGTPKVDAAVEKMSPSDGSGNGASAARVGASASISVTNYITVQGGGGDVATTFKAVADRVFDDKLRALLTQLGFSPALAAGGGAPT
jgi:hypothetical protein